MNRNQEALKLLAIVSAALIYSGAVIYGDIMFISVMENAFPASAMLRALAIAGAVMTAASAVLLPIALHFWFAPGLQFVWGIIFWGIDILALGLNSILAFSIANSLTPDSLLSLWQIFSPATPLLAVVGWGIAFLLDPSHRMRHAERTIKADLQDSYTDQILVAAKSDQIFSELEEGAQEAARQFASLVTGKHNGNPAKEDPRPNVDLDQVR